MIIHKKTFWTICVLWGLIEWMNVVVLRHHLPIGLNGALLAGIAAGILSAAAETIIHRGILLIAGLIAVLIKLTGIILSGYDLTYNLTANPTFAIFSQIVAFIIIRRVLDPRLNDHVFGNMLLGGFYALLAVNLFPLVKFVTGNPACTIESSDYPAALYYLPVTVLLSALLYPAGRYIVISFLGERKMHPVNDQ
ncbi:MAG: hypothetical protein GF313_00455 [Caldithrix sp.]|nr:hypothetical protein [Caldithrix sp.]